MPKLIYISGAITNQQPESVKRTFGQAEYELILEGHNVINPLTLCHDHDHSWEEYLAVDIKALLTADAIYMLSNWKKSRGARIERAIAKELGLDIIYQTSPSRIWWLKRLLAGREITEVSHA